MRGPIPPGGAAARYPMHWGHRKLEGGDVGIWTLPDPDVLLDELTQEQFDRSDDRMPYWATVWPSAVALAEVVLAERSLAGRRVLDLGCGLGLVGLAALERGARVVFLDWEPAAIAASLASARDNGHEAEGHAADWRAPPLLEPFDLVLGADVLYEERNGPGVARFLARHLVPGGEAWITDPGRRHAGNFPRECADARLTRATCRILPTPAGAAVMNLWKVVRPRAPEAGSGASSK